MQLTGKEPDIKFFEKEHKYFLDGSELISSTTFISQFFEKFDKEKWSKYVANRDGLSVEEVLRKWEINGKMAREFGTRVHNYAEAVIKKAVPPEAEDEKDISYFEAVERFFEEEDFEFFDAEKIVGSKDIGIAGTVDGLSKKDDGIYLIDWKTNKEIRTTGYNRCRAPINHLDDCNYTKYCLQLSLYRFILEQEYGWDVKGLKLVHLKPGRYFTYDIDYNKDAVVMMLAHTARL